MPDAMAVKAARWYGWKPIPNPYCKGSFNWTLPQRHGERKHKDRSMAPDYVSLDAVRKLEDEIETRGLWFEYALAVVHTVGDPVHDDANYRYFQLLRATAAQRLEAICAVIDKEPRNA